MRFPLTRETLRRSEQLVDELSARETEAKVYDGLLEVAVSGCRDVTRVLQREIEFNVPDLVRWYEARAQEMALPRNSAVLWLRDARNLSTKEEPSKVASPAPYGDVRTPKLSPGASFAVTDRGQVVRITKDSHGRETRQSVSEFDGGVGSAHRIVRPEPPRPLLLEGRDISGLDATETLRQYVGFLRQLVEAAESAKA